MLSDDSDNEEMVMNPAKKKKINDKKCIKCMQFIRKLPMRAVKTINSDEEATHYSVLLEKSINIGNILCKKCYHVLYTKEYTKSKIVQEQDDELQERYNEQLSLENLSSSENMTQTSSGSEYQPTETPPEIECVIMPFLRTVKTHAYCCLCRRRYNLIIIPNKARLQVFATRKVYIPKDNRICKDHCIKNKLYVSEIDNIHISANECEIPSFELADFISKAIKVDSILSDRVGDFSMSEEQLILFTLLNWENLIELRTKLSTLRNSKNRNVTQALVTFLFKLRTGNSDELISSILGLERHQQVSDFCSSVLRSFETDVLPKYFGVNSCTRDFLIDNHTSPIADKLHQICKRLALIADGTYIRHEKSSNNFYQRKSYSMHKKYPLCKPFTICTTDGFIVDLLGPFLATENDASILLTVLSDPEGLKKLLQPGDIFILDRGFRDVKSKLEEMGFEVLMPALKGQRKQLTAEESNSSRKTTKARWVVEAVHGIIGKKYRLLHQQLDNKLLPKVRLYSKIACYLNNTFGKRLNSDVQMMDEIIQRMSAPTSNVNELAEEVNEKRWSRRKTTLTKITSDDLLDFPEMTIHDLKIFFTGSYQLSQSVSYLAEIVDDDGQIELMYVKECPNIVQFQVKSRHINNRIYKCYIKYKSESVGISGILGHFCECANGQRTIGCCSHVAAIVYYLSHARYLSKVIRPAEILNNIFQTDPIEPVIDEDSDED